MPSCFGYMSPICGRKPFQKQHSRYPQACQQTSCHCPPAHLSLRAPTCLPSHLLAVGYCRRRRQRCPIRTQATSLGHIQPLFCTAVSPVMRRGLQQRCHCRPGAWWQVRWRVGVRLTYHACCPRHCAATLALVYAAGDGVSARERGRETSATPRINGPAWPGKRRRRGEPHTMTSRTRGAGSGIKYALLLGWVGASAQKAQKQEIFQERGRARIFFSLFVNHLPISPNFNPIHNRLRTTSTLYRSLSAKSMLWTERTSDE